MVTQSLSHCISLLLLNDTFHPKLKYVMVTQSLSHCISLLLLNDTFHPKLKNNQLYLTFEAFSILIYQ
jgi:chorismate mutase